ncbi:D-alanyl-D-alanine carboxypeptidase [Candidatus Daviesbacteria bacterium]|nr:D-alanyl-D-alanine carboxypeptidase [Candidatus Daviesbacteria bacterium]
MKKFVYLGLFFLLIFLIFFFIKFVNGDETRNLISPLVNNSKVLGVNLWLPNLEIEAKTEVPKVSAKAAFFIDSKSGKVLFAKNSQDKLPIASLAKVMAVLIALENKHLEDEYWVSERAANMEPDKMLLIPGETLNLKELLYGVFLISANDAAEVLAEETTGSREEFINLMNSKAKQLGMQNSFFVNPTGLDEDNGNSYSSVYDLAILTRFIIRNFPEVVEISKTDHIYLPITDKHQDYDMYSGINLLTTYEGVVGFKTGYTPQAGYTLITLARKGEHEVIGVLLDSEYRRDEAKELLDYSFQKLGL